MARAVRFTKAEREFLRAGLGVGGWNTAMYQCGERLAASITEKLDDAESDPVPGVAYGPIEIALVSSSRGKVLKLEGGWAMACRRATQVSATPEDAQLIGRWLAGSQWHVGPYTALDVFNKWHQWLPKARATRPPPSLGPGLGADSENAGRSTAQQGPGPAGGRPAPGLGRKAPDARANGLPGDRR